MPGVGEPYAFSVTVECAPKPELPALDTVIVDLPRLPELDPFVDQVLETTLQAAGVLEDTGKPAESGNEVTVDFTCTVDDEVIRGASAVGYQARIGDGRLLDELESAIQGQEAGSSLSVPVDFPDDHPMPQLAGRPAKFQLEIREVKQLVLPELTDEVAKQVSEFDTAKELRADLEDGVRARLQTEIDGIFRGNAVAALANAVEFTEPAQLVERRQHELYSGLTQQLARHGMTIEAYLGRTGQDQNELLESLADSARDDLRRELVLLALAEDAEIVIDEDDLRREVEEHSSHTGEDPVEAWKRIAESGRVDMLGGELLLQKTIDYLVSKVKSVEVDPPASKSDNDDAILAE
jgi:trigger factor